ncbi:MAG: glycosyltransferase family 39 protein, partial [Tepidisphaeraceae bacterium]
MTSSVAPIRRGPLWILLAILLAATVFRLHNLTAASLWFDERASVMSAEGRLADWLNLPLDRVIPAPDFSSTAHQASLLAAWRSPDFHPPLFAVTLRLWRDLFGDSDAAARSLSVVVSLVAIVFLFDLGRTLFDARSALWACGIMAVAQPQIQYAQEARGYALWAALFLAASAAAARLYKYGPGWRRAMALAACSVAMLLTHFLAFASVVAIGIWCGIYLRGRGARQTLIASAAALVVLLIVGAPLVSVAVENHQDAMWLREPIAGHIAATIERLALLPARFLAEPLKGTELLSSATAVAYVIPFLLFRRSAGMAWCA